jgi:hypothetical protein
VYAIEVSGLRERALRTAVGERAGCPLLPGGEKMPEGRMRAYLADPLTPALSPVGRGGGRSGLWGRDPLTLNLSSVRRLCLEEPAGRRRMAFGAMSDAQSHQDDEDDQPQQSQHWSARCGAGGDCWLWGRPRLGRRLACGFRRAFSAGGYGHGTIGRERGDRLRLLADKRVEQGGDL